MVPLDYPVQLSKVQAPPLRDDTLARDRLLDWLSVKVHGRVVLLVAEAGYGKTTLLADFSRRTRIRVLWFRLDRGDRDWIGFIAHLVAAVRVHMPEFGQATAGLLRDTAMSVLSLDDVLDTFLRELGSLLNDPTAVVFDDMHLVDDSPEVRQILRELVARAPDRICFLFASRREPPVRLARLRALGEVAELVTDDLRFDANETERLFSETYEMPLEPSVLAELNRRTEGWAASLQLVRAAIHDRNPSQVRTFISSLSGAEGHLYEYLAEEVIGDLPDDLQQFLMRTSVLDAIDLTLGPVAADVSEEETRRFVEQAERLGLVGRRGPGARGSFRAHPLVRDFLRARLRRALGEQALQLLHVRVAEAARSADWQVAAQHFIAAGRPQDAAASISGAVAEILSSGNYADAGDLVAKLPEGELDGIAGLVIRSRMAQRRADPEEALALAEAAWAVDKETPAVLIALIAARAAAGDVAGAIEAGRQLERSGRPEDVMGRVYRIALETSVSGSIVVATRELEALAEALRAKDARHYLGVTLLDLSLLRMAAAAFDLALAAADEAISLLLSSSAGVELVSAHLARGEALQFLGRHLEAKAEVAIAEQLATPGQALELAAEIGQSEALLGESPFGWRAVDRVRDEITPETDDGEQALLARALLRIQDGDVGGAREDVQGLKHLEPRSGVAFEARRLLAEGLVAVLAGEDGRAAIRAGTRLARAQGADLWVIYGSAIESLSCQAGEAHSGGKLTTEHPFVLSMLAELVVPRLSELDARVVARVIDEAERRPWRWRGAARRALAHGSSPTRSMAAQLLARIGETEDIPRLKHAERGNGERRTARFGHLLSRRLAARVFVEDLGRLRIMIGSRAIESGDVRRKVLALLCLLLTRPRFALTRDEVIDALWPDVDPGSALNSLNQTVYFLRRVFEPDYQDDLSPGYVGQDGEMIWLDEDLVDARSRRCNELIKAMAPNPTADDSVALAKEYRGRFALDFAYEEWVNPYRDALHAAYLRVMEHAIRQDLDSGHLQRGVFLAERAFEIDPDTESIQVALIRLYRHSGAHAAASEQYGHYARTMKDLGLEPPALADI